jgi:hypothetical protein
VSASEETAGEIGGLSVLVVVVVGTGNDPTPRSKLAEKQTPANNAYKIALPNFYNNS